MASLTNTSEWDDIPTSSELFGSDFFGDELMEMYTACDHLGDHTSSIITTSVASAVDNAALDPIHCAEDVHDGVLVAMNAAAMDGGLSPLGNSEFVPLAAESMSLPPYPVVSSTGTTSTSMAAAAATATETTIKPVKVEVKAAAPIQVTAPSKPAPKAAPVRTTRSAAKAAAAAPKVVQPAPTPLAVPSAPGVVAPKRNVSAAVTSAAAQGPTAKKQRKGVSVAVTKAVAPAATPKPSAATAAQARPVAQVPQAKVAATGGVKVTIPPSAAASAAAKPPVTRSIGRVVSSASVSQAPKATAARAVVPTATTVAKGAAPVPVRSQALLKKPGVAVPHPKTVVRSAAAVPKTVGAGGINHSVLARPHAVPSSAVAGAVRIMQPAAHLTAVAKASGLARTAAVPTATMSATGVKRASTEADFKDVASAAVSSLVQNASSTALKGGHKPLLKPGEKAIDTSTAHINALTSQNWVTACNPIPTPDPSSSSACDKAARNARRATLTQEERAKQNRDRNREHARNTRLRKKAYVEELKRTLTELVAQRDQSDLEKRHEAQRNREQREVRFRVMEEFLKLRGRNELNAARWVAILEDGFTFTLPKTSYRRMAEDKASDANSSEVEQVLRGATVVMEDSAHLSSYLQTIGGPSTSTAGAAASQVQVAYTCDRKRFFMDGNVAFMDFTATTSGAVAKGATNEVVFKGSMKSSFSPASNKLITVDLQFDTGAIVSQVEALGVESSTSTDAQAAAAAHEADALLDSLQMPQIFVDKKDVTAAAAAVAAAEAVAPGPVSVSSDDGERSME